VNNSYKIVIIDIGISNVKSVQRMLEYIGIEPEVLTIPRDFDPSCLYILPGIGTFDSGVKALHSSGWADFLTKQFSLNSLKLLGICLGMQLLFEKSEEGKMSGLGLIEGEAIKFDNDLGLKVPHMGWANISKMNLWPGNLKKESRFYHVHSYFCIPKNSSEIIGIASYGNEFVTAVRKKNIFGVQFHPEKSHKHGINFFQDLLNEIF